jgi:hypothetical protein
VVYVVFASADVTELASDRVPLAARLEQHPSLTTEDLRTAVAVLRELLAVPDPEDHHL